MCNLRQDLIELAEAAGEIALSWYGDVPHDLKQDASPVTRADREVEVFLQRELARLDPRAPFIGEESTRDSAMISRARSADRVWVVDPIDGTASFLAELDTFCVCVAQLRGGAPHAGVVLLPALRQCYSAVKGQGAIWRSERRELALTPEQAASIPAAAACLLVPSGAHRQFDIDAPGKVRSLGSTALHFCLVARGVGIATGSTSYIWDYAAAAAVLEEAGGLLRHADGGALDWRAMMDGRQVSRPVLGAFADTLSEVPGWFEPRRRDT